MLESEGDLLALEIESGKGYKKHRALDHLKEFGNGRGGIRYYVLSDYNLESEDGIDSFPIYMVRFLKESEGLDAEVPLDIGSL